MAAKREIAFLQIYYRSYSVFRVQNFEFCLKIFPVTIADQEPPLPISNREVKMISADVTASIASCGKVGIAGIYQKPRRKARFLFAKID